MLGLDKNDKGNTYFVSMITFAAKLASESACGFPPLDTYLISNTSKIDISFLISFKYFFIISSLASKVLLT